MAVSQTITDTHVQDFIIKAVKNVCSTMIREEASFVERTAEAAYTGFKDKVYVFGTVGFEGDVNGVQIEAVSFVDTTISIPGCIPHNAIQSILLA